MPGASDANERLPRADTLLAAEMSTREAMRLVDIAGDGNKMYFYSQFEGGVDVAEYCSDSVGSFSHSPPRPHIPYPISTPTLTVEQREQRERT